MKKRKIKRKSPYGLQAICMTRSAASEAVARVLINFEDTPMVTVAELSGKIIRALGFK